MYDVITEIGEFECTISIQSMYDLYIMKEFFIIGCNDNNVIVDSK